MAANLVARVARVGDEPRCWLGTEHGREPGNDPATESALVSKLNYLSLFSTYHGHLDYQYLFINVS